MHTRVFAGAIALTVAMTAPTPVWGQVPQPKTINIAAPPMVADRIVPDAVVVQLDPVAVLITDAVGLAPQGRTGVDTLDRVATQFGVNHLRKQFPGADPVLARQRNLPDLSGFYVVTFDTTLGTVDEVLNAYRADPLVKSVEAIGMHPLYAVPNDGNYATQWHLNQANDKDMDAPEAWNVETGDASIVVAVLDSGVRYYHKDLGGLNASSTNPTAADGNVWINLAEKNGAAGVDDDGNGYVDDWVGYDFVNGATPCWSGEDCNGIDNDPRDFNGHGTHCAGNIAAINNNGYATASPSGGWGNGTLQPTGNGVKVMCLRMGWSGSSLGQEVGYVRMDYAASAFYYAANKGAKVASCSWGSSNSGGIAAAIDFFIASGGLVFVAAGNSNNQTAGYVNSRTDCYSVASTNQSDVKSSFSSYGTWVDISAPGSAILSSYHNHNDAAADYVATLDGTSMATPLVASTAAAVWSKNPGWTAAQVWQRVRDTADNISALNPSYNGLLGSGRVNLFNAVNSGPSSFCGDGTCNPGETPCNCPQDCGAPPAEICNDGLDNDCDGFIDCLDGNCAGAPNCVTPQCIVDCITYTTNGGNNGLRNLVATIKVVNASGAVVSGASVTATISGPTTWTATVTTNSSGLATISRRVNNGCYTTNVTNIVLSGHTFDGTEPSNGFRKGTDATPDADCRSGSDGCG